MAEWPIAAVLKTAVQKWTVGSNPTSSEYMNHLELAQSYWEQVLRKGDNVIDATCGNGKDTLRLAKLTVMRSELSQLIGIDIQALALERTKNRLAAELTEEQRGRISLYEQSHSCFPALAHQLPIRLIVYNLGYLPSGDKTITTRVETTLESVNAALLLLMPGGLISITCYPGHFEGAREEKALLHLISTLISPDVQKEYKTWPLGHSSPSLILIRKSDLTPNTLRVARHLIGTHHGVNLQRRKSVL